MIVAALIVGQLIAAEVGSVSGEGGVQSSAVFSDQLTHGISTVCTGFEPMHEAANHGAANDHTVGN